ncbi:SAG1386/EF1546 family surface-associated protein [Streptococcus sp. CSL10205-OR2]|uniref:SAG1386/EF1546 family surface-associated protein n=1 Tax=Streptococcus sp. CSL10205-OR2 TaxID=2980558 RepID=UPI0021D95F88|nr:SAG1386/EF1546 family surface-associated protein [Streptococcus sp. CSL10205-OR2]MCU9533757.1 LysM peptidoglycan-binding domain-containing protein [Streptococcus sp. CSL10205-OR2]
MVKKPWEMKVFAERRQNNSRKHKVSTVISTPFLTILLVVFFAIIVGILLIVVYTSNGGSEKQSLEEAFYNPNRTTQSVEQETTQVEETTEVETTVETPKENRKTIIVEAGEGPSRIAERGGISLEKLYELNPDKMSTGSWLAHPGDEVFVE